jgi:hypothetical protein
MHYSILEEFDGKNVAVYVAGNRFTGILKLNPTNTILSIAPADAHDQKRYGNVIVDGNLVTAIREIKPRPISTHSDEDDCGDCEKAS